MSLVVEISSVKSQIIQPTGLHPGRRGIAAGCALISATRKHPHTQKNILSRGRFSVSFPPVQMDSGELV